jgi:hypothetical protein
LALTEGLNAGETLECGNFELAMRLKIQVTGSEQQEG